MAKTAPQTHISTDDHGIIQPNPHHHNGLQPTLQEAASIASLALTLITATRIHMPRQQQNCCIGLPNNGHPKDLQIFLPNANEPHVDTCQYASSQDDQEFFKEMRGWLMIVAILAAGSTYQAGLNPPGSFWQNDDDHGRMAGNPVLHDTAYTRYEIFYYCNAFSFLSSLAIISLLMNKHFYRQKVRIKVLKITMMLDLFSFMAAYAIGSRRKVRSSIFIFAMVCGVFLYIILFVVHYPRLQKIASRMQCMRTRAAWRHACPV